ncbi:hypothetical protein BJG93_27285 [Paraburkholderia sprentiae WSM5005]|uniref:Uncharacterized protein n=1 Tax=Paraburkholderia sprentiae WSM5005 TaxID=754502 RepID=A0A1I9YRY5_9BURK|nr:hypothetical protein [Paraburkholderia sprentiae]APA88975.1 hypothetical protein BJG93_27285 [Paraburkholderia sprentiae WSM5005]
MSQDSGPSALRDALFEHEIFTAGALQLPHVHVNAIGQHEATWDFTQTELEEELARMRSLRWIDCNSIGYWYATEIGQIAREQRWQAPGRRHPALGDARSTVEDLILALLHSEAAEPSELLTGTLRLPERVLAVYLAHIDPALREQAVDALLAADLVARGPDMDNPGESALFSTREGDKAYARAVVPRLGLCPPATLLSRDHVEGLPFHELGLESLAAENLAFRWEEAQRCMRACAWLASAVLYGSMLELLLGDWLSRDEARARSARRAPKHPQTGIVPPLWEMVSREVDRRRRRVRPARQRHRKVRSGPSR